MQFTATVTNAPSTTVVWRVNGASGGNDTSGTIDQNGLYTAPSVAPAPNTVRVTAEILNPLQRGSSALTISNPAPSLEWLSPAQAVQGGTDAEITVVGTGLTSQSVVYVKGAAVPTVFGSSKHLNATIPAAQLVNAGTVALEVRTPAPGGGTSGQVSLHVLGSSEAVQPTNHPQVAQYNFQALPNASVVVEFGPDTNYGLRTSAQAASPAGGTVSLLVAGMKPHTTYHMRAVATYPDNSQFTDTDHTFITGGLPPNRTSPIRVTRPNNLTPTPGALFLHLWSGKNDEIVAETVDNDGDVIWYYDYSTTLAPPTPYRLLDNGHILICAAPLVREIDLAGNVISEFSANNVNNWLALAGYDMQIESIHHDLLPLPNGHLILLVNHRKAYTDVAGYPGTTNVLGDAIIDLDQNRVPVWVWDSFDHLDVNRHPMDLPDWTHSNALAYSPDDGNLILSIRHQHWVIKIDYADGAGTGAIKWRLGREGDFALTNGEVADWFYAQHFSNFVSPNSAGVFRLELFDNGDNRVLDASGNICGATGQAACHSRVPIFQLDESAMTATIVWHKDLSPVYSPWGGSAQLLSSGNAVFGLSAPSDNPTGGRYMEVTTDPDPQTVLQLDVDGQNMYRGVHVPSLYPGVQW